MAKEPTNADIQQVMTIADCPRQRAIEALTNTSSLEAAVNYIFNNESSAAAPSGGDADLQRVIHESMKTATAGNNFNSLHDHG